MRLSFTRLLGMLPEQQHSVSEREVLVGPVGDCGVEGCVADMLRIFRAIGAELNIAATNTIPPLNPSRKGSDSSQIRDMFSTP